MFLSVQKQGRVDVLYTYFTHTSTHVHIRTLATATAPAHAQRLGTSRAL